MSKLLKSKFLFGVMIVAVAFVGVFALTAAPEKAAASTCTFTTTLKVGVRSAEVTCLQTALGVSPATGYFGPLTKAAVVAWQASKGLVADGVFGPKSMAVWATGTVAGNYPAGCTSNSGYSSTTGQPCSGGGSYPAGCTSNVGFSPTTGMPCSGGVNLPAGCTSTAGFSPTTGASCSGGVSPSNGAGDLTVTASTVDTDNQVLEGDVAKAILSWKAQATGSAITVSNAKVSFINTDTSGSSTRLERYASEVSVWMGSTKVGSVAVSDFSKTGTTYSANIALSGAVVQPGVGNKQTFFVKVTALPSIDSTDISTNDWTATVNSTRYADGTGIVLTDTTSITNAGTDAATGVLFASLASGDMKLTVSKGSGMPLAGNVRLSTSTTTKVLVNEFKLKAEGSKMTVNSISLAVSTPVGDLSHTTGEMTIEVGGVQVAANDATLNADDTYVFTLDDPMDIAAGSTVTFDVYAKVNKLAGGSYVTAADSLLVSYSTSNVEDSNGDTIAGGNRAGTAVGNTQVFYANGLNLTFVSASATRNVSSDPATVPDSGTYVIKFNATNFGDTDLYIDNSTEDDNGVNAAGQGTVYEVFKNGAATAPAVGSYATASGILSAGSTTGTDVANDYIVLANSTRQFTLTVNFALDKADGTNSDGFYRVLLDSVNWGTAADDTNASYYSSNLGDFKTDDITLSDY